jgi:hypothetical protein
MKRLISIFCLFAFFTIGIFPQQSDLLNNSSANQKPQKVFRYCYVIKSQEWYKTQEDLWKKEISENPRNEDAWYNYYFASRYARMREDEKVRKEQLNLIVDEIGKAIPHSYLYPYLKYYNGNRKVEYLKKAYQIKPDCADLFWDFVQYYELNRMEPLKKEFCEKLYSSKVIISSLYDYNFNVLNSAEKNSILFSNGDNDTYPVWVLQEAKGIRTDVLLLNIHSVFVLRDYLKKKLDERGIAIDLNNLPKDDLALFFKELVTSITNKYPEISIHVAPTVFEGYKSEIKDKLYVTGLLYTYSKKQIDNVALIKRNLEQNLRLDYLEYDWYNENNVSQPLIDKYNLNYVPAFIELAKMYHSEGNSEVSEYWQNKAVHLANKVDDEDLLKRIKDLSW